MSGKPRRKKGETLDHYRERVKAWEATREIVLFGRTSIEIDDPNGVFDRAPINCGTCYHWGENNQCFRYPKITVTTERHRCGEHKTK